MGALGRRWGLILCVIGATIIGIAMLCFDLFSAKYEDRPNRSFSDSTSSRKDVDNRKPASIDTVEQAMRPQELNAVEQIRQDVLRNESRSAESTIDDASEHSAAQRQTTDRYRNARGRPQVVYGRIAMPAKILKAPLLMRLRIDKKPGGVPIAVDEEGRFAFTAVAPGKHDVVLYETPSTPGMRHEAVIVEEGKSVDELVLPCGQCSAIVRLTDDDGHEVSGAKVIVGKRVGQSGTYPNTFTWRTGITDEHGLFTASDLLDGEYVVTCQLESKSISRVITLREGVTSECPIRIGME